MTSGPGRLLIASMREEAEIALAIGELDRALELFRRLEMDNPADGLWPHRVADVYQRMGRNSDQLASLARAADLYLEAGVPLRAVVMSKRMLEIAPRHPETDRILSLLHPKLRALVVERPRRVVLDAPDGWTPAATLLDSLPVVRSSTQKLEAPAWPVEIPLLSEPGQTADELAKWSTRVTPLFAALSESSFRALMQRLRLVELEKDDFLFRQGAAGESLFVISEGVVRVVREQPKRIELARLDEGEFFGEIALVTNQPRTATIEAVTSARLIEIDRRTIADLIQEDAHVMTVLLWFIRDRLVDTLVRTSPLFEKFPYAKRRQLADRFRFIEAHSPVALIAQGQAARGLMIVLSGRAEVIRSFGDREIRLAELKAGDICGEMSLLSAEPAVASVIARDHFIGLLLPAGAFAQLTLEHPYLVREIERIAELRRQKLVAAIEGDEGYSEGSLLLL